VLMTRKSTAAVSPEQFGITLPRYPLLAYDTIRHDTIIEFNVDLKAEYTA